MAAQVIKMIAGIPHEAVGAAPHHLPSVNLSEVSVPPPAFMGLEGLHLRTVGTDVFQLIPLGFVRVPCPFSHCRGGVNKGVRPGETSSKLSLLSHWQARCNCLLQCSSKLWPKFSPYIPTRGHFCVLPKFLRTVDFKENL